MYSSNKYQSLAIIYGIYHVKYSVSNRLDKLKCIALINIKVLG